MKINELIEWAEKLKAEHGDDLTVTATMEGIDFMLPEVQGDGRMGVKLEIDTWTKAGLHVADLMAKINDLDRGDNLEVVQFARWEGHYHFSEVLERVTICERDYEDTYWGDFEIIYSETNPTKFWKNPRHEADCDGSHYEAIILTTDVY